MVFYIGSVDQRSILNPAVKKKKSVPAVKETTANLSRHDLHRSVRDDVFSWVSVFSGEKKAVWVRLFALCGKNGIRSRGMPRNTSSVSAHNSSSNYATMQSTHRHRFIHIWWGVGGVETEVYSAIRL